MKDLASVLKKISLIISISYVFVAIYFQFFADQYYWTSNFKVDSVWEIYVGLLLVTLLPSVIFWQLFKHFWFLFAKFVRFLLVFSSLFNPDTKTTKELAKLFSGAGDSGIQEIVLAPTNSANSDKNYWANVLFGVVAKGMLIAGAAIFIFFIFNFFITL